MTGRPDSCPDCGAGCRHHTGSYCHECGYVLVAEKVKRGDLVEVKRGDYLWLRVEHVDGDRITVRNETVGWEAVIDRRSIIGVSGQTPLTPRQAASLDRKAQP